MLKIQTECGPCDGTGLYCGFAEPEGTAVVCHGCGGTGATTLSYRPYTGRRRRRGVKKVMSDGGLWMVRTGDEKTIDIKDFYDKLPEAEQE